MGIHYSHLSDSDRLYIEVLHRHGASCAGIARYLRRHRSTISREFSRAKSFGVRSYIAHFGQRYYSASRRRAGLARRKLGPDLRSPAWQHVRAGLALHRSPQEIAGRLRDSCFVAGSHLLHPAYAEAFPAQLRPLAAPTWRVLHAARCTVWTCVRRGATSRERYRTGR